MSSMGETLQTAMTIHTSVEARAAKARGSVEAVLRP